MMADDTAALQAMIDAAIGPGNPATTVRQAVATIHVPAGTYRIARPLRIASAEFVRFCGDGGATRLQPVGTLDCVLDINGVAHSTFEDIRIEGDGTESVTDAIRYSWDPATAARSSMRNVFSRILIRNTRCVTAFRVGKPGSGVQCDQTAYRDLSLEGNFGARDPAWHRAGMHLGDGVFGNCLVHSAYNLSVGGFASGVVVDATNFALFAGSFGHNGTDILGLTHGYLCVEGFRSEDSSRFFESIGPSSNVSLYRFSDVIWTANKIAPDGEFVRLWTNGNAILENVAVTMPVTGSVPKVVSRPARSSTVQIRGVTSSATLSQFLVLGPSAASIVEGYYQHTDAAGQVGAMEGLLTSAPLKWPGAGALCPSNGTLYWINNKGKATPLAR